MFTECPSCNSVFRVTAKVLQQARGQVRCGSCGVAFSALDYLTEELPGTSPDNNDTYGDAPRPPGDTRESNDELLARLNELAGPEDVLIEDTGTEWRVLDELIADIEASKLADAGGTPGTGTDGELAALPAETESVATPDSGPDEPDAADPPAPQPPDQLPLDGSAAWRFDDHTPHPDSVHDDHPEEPAPRRRAEDQAEYRDAETVDENQVDFILSEPGDWSDLLDEVQDEDPAADEMSLEVEEELAAIHSQLSAREPVSPAAGEDDEDRQVPNPTLDTLIAPDGTETLLAVIDDEPPRPGDAGGAADDELADGIAPEASQTDDIVLEDDGAGDDESDVVVLESDGPEDDEPEEIVLEGDGPDEDDDPDEIDFAGDDPEDDEPDEIDFASDDTGGDDLNELVLEVDDLEDDEPEELTLDGEEWADNDVEEILFDEGDAPRADEDAVAEAGDATGFEDESQAVETIIMEGDSIRHALEQDAMQGMAADGADAADGDTEAADMEVALLETDDDLHAIRGGRRRTDPPSYAIIAGTVLCAVLLIGQVVHAYRYTLSTSPLFDHTIGSLYRLVGQPITPEWNIQGWQFESTNGNIRGNGETLTIVSRIRNKADMALPYPLVHVSLTDRWEEIIGSRVLTPAEYLAGDIDPDRLVEPGDEFRAVITVDAPADDATGFKLNVCYRDSPGRLRCATEDFKD